MRLLFVLSILLICCKAKRDFDLPSGLQLTYLDSKAGKNFFIVDKKGKTVVPPSILNLSYNDNLIWGVVDFSETTIFGEFSSGFFAVKVSSKEVYQNLAGLNEIEERFQSLMTGKATTLYMDNEHGIVKVGD